MDWINKVPTKQRDSNPLETLRELLTGHAKPVINADRLAPSATYDLDYRLAVIALAFEQFAKPVALGRRRIATARLKLFQFIAQRPWLLPVIKQWGDAQQDAKQSLLAPQRLRRGYVDDRMFNDMIDFLVARGSLVRSESHLTETGTQFSREVNTRAHNEGLFQSERATLEALKFVTLTKAMLEGA
jgi:hypothetical protein